MAAVAGDFSLLGQAAAPLPASTRGSDESTQLPHAWWQALVESIGRLLRQIDARRIARLAVAGTSGTLLVCDKLGNPLAPALMYDDRRAREQVSRIGRIADADSGAHGEGSSLAKLLWLRDNRRLAEAAYALHQADWIANRLAGRFGHSDCNNCLKLGYDVRARRWPAWLEELGVDPRLLPQVHAPGETIATVDRATAAALGLPADVQIVAGTTDGVAAFLAAGARLPGDGVTSLGSTLVLKLLSRRPVFSAPHGVYSHPLGALWLAGGASNSGGAVLLRYFSANELSETTQQLDPAHLTGLDYYPLASAGERFPIADPALPPRLSPRPTDAAKFLQGMLEGMARIEARGYETLAALGAPALERVWSIGGGARNAAWHRIRERALGKPVRCAASEDAAYGAALLAAGVIDKAFS